VADGATLDLRFTPEQERFRAEVRAWLATNAPRAEDGPVDGRDLVEFQRAWQASLASQDLVAVHWPPEFGGRGLGWIEAFLVQEEVALARAPEIVNRIAVNLVGPTLLEHGTADQRDRYLRRILTAEDLWCQLFSEPGAGSDLASMATGARRVPGGWRITGQKVWASNAQYSRYGVLLARTGDAEGARPPIGYFLVDMDQDGIDVHPLRQMTGESEFNEVFIDHAFVPDDGVVGDPGGGWAVMSTTLGYERATSPRQLIVHTVLLDELLAQARAEAQDAPVRDRLARAYCELRIYRLHLYRILTALDRGGEPGAASSIVKLFWSEMAQRMHDLSMAMLGPAAITEWSRRQRNFLYYRACTIFAGTSEIQRNTLAEQALGLPRQPRPEGTSPSPSPTPSPPPASRASSAADAQEAPR
jgi:alkylation response protein AidB-like acyl-CoA dehydrogenase